MKRILTPLNQEVIEKLKVGDKILLSGVIYTARDQAHKRIVKTIKKGKKLPFPLEGEVIFYCGPSPTPPDKIIGSCGPTTSSRMDKFTPILLKHGLKGMIGKGVRSEDVIEAIKKYKAIYFIAVGGAGAYLSTKIIQVEIIAYPELDTEAIYKLKVENFPLIVGIDCNGRNIYKGSFVNNVEYLI